MPKTMLKVKKAFKWAHRHVDVKEYAKGDFIETDDEDLIKVSTDEGWTAKTTEKPDNPAAVQVEALKQEIADLEAKHGKAKEEERAGLLEQLNAKREELKQLEAA